MKGLMVTLLALLMTGTVIGQQQKQQDGNAKPGRFVIWLNDNEIQELKRNPLGLISELKEGARGKLTEVRLRYDKIAMKAKDTMPKSDSRFNVWLNDNSIEKLVDSTYGLVASVPDNLKDNIVEVVLMHDKNQSYATKAPPAPGPQPDNSGIQISGPAGSLPPQETLPRDLYGTRNTTQPNRTVGKQNYNNNDFASNSSERRDFGSQSPRQGGQFGSQSTRTPTLSEKLRQINERSRSGDFDRGQKLAQEPPQTQRPQNPRPNERTQPYPDREPFRPRFDQTAQTGDSFQQPVRRPISDPNAEYSYELERRRLANLPVTNRGLAPNHQTPTQNNTDIEFEREMLRRQTEKLQSERAASSRIQAQRQLAEDRARYEDELYLQKLRDESLAGVNSRNSITPRYPNYIDERYASRVVQPTVQNPSNQFPNRRAVDNRLPASYDYDRLPSRTKPVSTPRVAQNGLSLEIPGNKSNKVTVGNSQKNLTLGEARHNDRAYGFMFFMLMFSIGLNVYLAWIARGFYVRYSELADELRETFTSTM